MKLLNCICAAFLSACFVLTAWGGPVFRVPGFDARSVSFNVPDLIVRARQGDGEAYYQLGVMFLCGHETKQNHFIAYDYLCKAHEQGYGYASLLLGMSREFGGGFVEKGVAFCEDLPFRALIAAYHPQSPWGLDSDKTSARDYYGQALSNGVQHAQFCLARLDRAEAERTRQNRQWKLDVERIYAGDCRTPEERRMYEKRKAQQEKFRQEENARQAKMAREREEREQAKRRQLEEGIAALKAEQQRRLATAESGKDPVERYWAACFLRAWAATADDEPAGRRVALARRALKNLEVSAAAGYGQAAYDLGCMLIGGDTEALGPRPAHRGGFLSDDDDPGRLPFGEWIPESIEVVKSGDVRGPRFAPDVLSLDVSKDGVSTSQVAVCVYRQDVPRGMALLRRAAADNHKGALDWFAERQRIGLPDDAVPWALATDSFKKETANPVLQIRRYERQNAYLGRVYREITIDRTTGEIVGRSQELSEYPGRSPWK